jgi:uncharacterized protein DUF6328
MLEPRGRLASAAMTKLKDKVTNALNETRILILGAQILLGFQFNAAFQPGIKRIAEHARALDLTGMTLMMLAVALMIAPGAFHRLAEGGHDSARIHAVTTGFAKAAMVPFALCIGLDVLIVAGALFTPPVSVAFGIVFTGFAALLWYGLEAAQRARFGAPPMSDEKDEEPHTPLNEKIKTMMTETRVVLPGAQAMLGFQFTAFLTDGFSGLREATKLVHFASLCCVALSIILLMAPAAYHRIVAHGEDRADVEHFGSAVMLASLVPLALGLTGDFYVTAEKLEYGGSAAVAAAAVALLVFLGLWFVYPLIARTFSTAASPPSGEHERA